MKVCGYSLRTAIKNRETERDAAASALQQALRGSAGLSLEELMNKIENSERAIAKLQAFQARYNLEVTIDVNSEKISMAEAIKRIGGIERVSQHWRKLVESASGSGMAVAMVSTLDSEKAINKAKAAATEASTLRGRMSAANALEIEIAELEESLME